jgi:hypothetical protein
MHKGKIPLQPVGFRGTVFVGIPNALRREVALSQGKLFEQKRTCTELAPCIDRDSTSCGKQENGSPLKSTSGAREHKCRRGIQESLA